LAAFPVYYSVLFVLVILLARVMIKNYDVFFTKPEAAGPAKAPGNQ